MWTPARFVWQVQHLELPRLDLCGSRGAFSTFIEVCGSLATSLSCVDAGLFCAAGAALGAPYAICVAGVALSVPSWRSAEAWRRACPVWTPARFVWQAQHLELLRVDLCGRPGTFSTFIEVCGSLATSLSGSFCVAGAAFELPRLDLCGRRGTFSTFMEVCGSLARACPVWTPARFVWQVRRLELPSLDLRGRRGAFSTFMEVCGSLARACPVWTPARFVWQVQRLELFRLDMAFGSLGR